MDQVSIGEAGSGKGRITSPQPGVFESRAIAQPSLDLLNHSFPQQIVIVRSYSNAGDTVVTKMGNLLLT